MNDYDCKLYLVILLDLRYSERMLGKEQIKIIVQNEFRGFVIKLLMGIFWAHKKM